MAAFYQNLIFGAALIASFVSVNVADMNTTTSGSRTTYGDPLKCYECSSHPEKDGKACDDPIDMEKFTPITCDSGLCLKYVQNIENKVLQINRGCAEYLEEVIIEKEETEGCVLSTGTKLVQVQICNCNAADGCNGAAEIKSATSVILAAGLAFFLTRIIH